MNVALNEFTNSWETFVMGICAREKLPKWERLWDDCIQEETRRESRSSKHGGGATDENFRSGKDFRMIAFRRRLVESPDVASMEEV